MARIALVSTQIIPRDAVGNDMLVMHRLLRARGHEVAFFADYWDVNGIPVRYLRELPEYLRDPSDILLYHHCTAWDGGPELFRSIRCRKILRYHNVTPAHFFEGLSEMYAYNCRRGREQLKEYIDDGCDLCLSASAYNQRELVALGAEPSRCRVVSPFHDIERLHSVEADPTVLGACRDGRTNLLFVGRIAPNKGHAALIEAFAVYHRHHNAGSRLILVGREDPSLSAYSMRLRSLAESLGVRGAVVFTGGASDAALKAYYECADVFLSASEHEGFCVPLVEAMALGLPVVAVATSGIPDTLGPAGFLWPDADPFVLAESVRRIVEDEEVRQALHERGQQRFAECFAGGRIESDFWNAVNELCPPTRAA